MDFWPRCLCKDKAVSASMYYILYVYCIVHIKALNHNQIFRWKCSGFVTFEFFHVICMFVLLIYIDKACSLQLSTVYYEVLCPVNLVLSPAVFQWNFILLYQNLLPITYAKQILTGIFYLLLKCPCWSIICRYSFVIITANQATHYISCLRPCC